VILSYFVGSKEWIQIQDLENLSASRNQRAVVYQKQLLIIQWGPSNSIFPIKIQYHDLSNIHFESL